MVTITKEGFVIHFASNQPANDYVETLNDLITLIQDRDPVTSEKGNFYACELIKEMMPTEEQARLLFGGSAKIHED